MHIDNITITNYKSFLETQTIQLEHGFNLLLGTNNAGKTSILDVIDMNIGLNEPHRSERTIPQYGGQNIEASKFEVTLSTRFNELWRIAGGSELFLPLAQGNESIDSNDTMPDLERVIANNEEILLTSTFSQGHDVLSFKSGSVIAGSASQNNPNVIIPSAVIRNTHTPKNPQIQIGNYSEAARIMCFYAQNFKSRIYRFHAQRRPGFQCGGQNSNVLDREALTLPYCLNNLQTNDSHGHKLLCDWVSRVFPSVKWVQSTSSVNNFEIRCLPLKPEIRRDDLSIPMSQMGAGIGNVIAILYVVLTAREPQVIAIDEPNAFLHPRALRELLAILEAEGKQHQFILTAHSADVLTAVNTRSISLLEFDGVATKVKQVGSKDLYHLRADLADLGIRMTDLHAKDHVFWVEGQTEEMVMPMLLRWACPEVAAGTAVLRVEATGTFSKKKGIEPAEVARIYERLSSSSALVPPMVCILLDGETLPVEKRNQIEASSKGKLRFLERRMLENYLLHSEAIHALLSDMGFSVDIKIVSDSIDRAMANSDLISVDAASVLKSCFTEFTESTFEFRKTRDVPELIKWILANDQESLIPLRACLRKSFDLPDKPNGLNI